MVPEPLDDLYLEWLYRQVGSVRFKNPNRTYWSLFRLLYSKEFIWLIPNDDNRVEDGRALRYEFLDEEDIDYRDREWLNLSCSMLEMLIALSRRLSFEAEGEPRAWFWHLLHNLELDHYNDFEIQQDAECETEIHEILDTVIWRIYERDGHGGLFPLRRSATDQTEVEIWYQLAAYLLQ